MREIALRLNIDIRIKETDKFGKLEPIIINDQLLYQWNGAVKLLLNNVLNFLLFF